MSIVDCTVLEKGGTGNKNKISILDHATSPRRERYTLQSKARFLRTAFLFNLYLEKLNWNKR